MGGGGGVILGEVKARPKDIMGGGGRGDFRRSKSAPQRHYQL